MTRLRWAPLAIALVGCSLVDNPNYLALADDETASAGETSETGTGTSTSTGTSAADTGTSETDASTSETSSDTGVEPCPPGKSGELGCPCSELELCDEGLNCVDGACSMPSNCPPEDPSVGVAIDLGNNVFAPEVQVGSCLVFASVAMPDTLILDTAQCDGPVNAFSIAIAPFPADSLPGLWQDTSASVSLRAVSQQEVYLRMSGPFDLWLVIAPTIDSGEPTISDYPGPLIETSGDCPQVTEPCGTSQRRALQAGSVTVFDANAFVEIGSRIWVDEAKQVCGTPSVRFAWILG